MEIRSATTFSVSTRAQLMALVIAIVLAGCRAQGQETVDMPPPPEVDVAEVEASPVTLWASFNGLVEAAESVELRPRVSGYIQQVAFEEGDLVAAGDLLFQIDPRPYQAKEKAARAELARARSELELAGSEARRASTLLKRRAISREQHDQRQAALAGARARVDAAQAALDTAELDLEYTRVTAPVSGRTGRALATRGNLAIADQTLMMTLVSVDPVYVYFQADEKTAFRNPQQMVSGQPLRIYLGDSDNPPYLGQLDFIDNHLNPDTGTLQYRAVLENPDGRLRPGQFARVEMPVAELDQALLVTRKAVLTDQDRRFVYVVNDTNHTERRQVTLGGQLDDLIVIRDGLRSGDRVVVNGVKKIFGAGMEVNPQRVAMGVPGTRDDDTIAKVLP